MAAGMIVGYGFCQMAWRLAISRVAHATPGVRYRISREQVERAPPGRFPVHREYYRILDNATFWAAHARGGPSNPTRRCHL